MSRPKKQTIDYFSHDCEHGKTLFVLEEKYGNDGYAFWFKLLECLGKTEGHYYDFNNSASKMYLLSKTRLSEVIAADILTTLSEMEAIDKELWGQGIIWSQKFVDRLEDVYLRRKVNKPLKPTLTPSERDKCQQKPHSSDDSANINPQSKVKERKVKYIKPLSSDSDEIRLSELLFSLIQQRDVNVKKPNMQTWGRQIDLLMRVDNRGRPEIEKVIKWCQGDPFWQNNILSTKKLREKFTQLLFKMNGGNGNGNGRNYQPSAAAPAAKTGSARSDGQPYPVDLEA